MENSRTIRSQVDQEKSKQTQNPRQHSALGVANSMSTPELVSRHGVAARAI